MCRRIGTASARDRVPGANGLGPALLAAGPHRRRSGDPPDVPHRGMTGCLPWRRWRTHGSGDSAGGVECMQPASFLVWLRRIAAPWMLPEVGVVMPYVRRAGVRLHYAEAGSGPAVLCTPAAVGTAGCGSLPGTPRRWPGTAGCCWTTVGTAAATARRGGPRTGSV